MAMTPQLIKRIESMELSNTTMDAVRLKNLAEEINKKHNRFRLAERQAVNYAVEAGKLLLQAKQAVGHGNFIAWLEEHSAVSSRQARRYMRIATAVAENLIDLDTVRSLAEAEGFLRDQCAEPAPEAREPETTGKAGVFLKADGATERNREISEQESKATAPANATAPRGRNARKSPKKSDQERAVIKSLVAFIHETPGEEKDRIQAIRARLEKEESELLVRVSDEVRAS